MFRVVFDTNILLSAFLFGGNPERLFELARSQKIQLFVSTSILAEFASILTDKFDWDDEDVKDAILTVGYSAELVRPVKKIKILDDDADNRVLECAVQSKADFIVSGDSHLLSLGVFRNIRILRAAELLSELK